MCFKSFFNKIMSSKNKNTTDASSALISSVELEKVIQETMQNTLKEILPKALADYFAQNNNSEECDSAQIRQDITGYITSIRRKLSEVNDEISKFKKTEETLNKGIEDRDNSIQALKAIIDTLEVAETYKSAKETQEGRITDLEQQQIYNEGTIKKLKESIAPLNQELKAEQQKNSNLEQEKKEKEETINKQREELEQQKEKHQNEISVLQKKIDDLEIQSQDYIKKIEASQTENAQLKQEQTNHQSEINARNTQINELNQQLLGKEQEIGELNGEITSLNQQLLGKRQEIDKLSGEIAPLEQQLQEYRQSINELNAQIAQYSQQHTTDCNTIELQKKEIEELENINKNSVEIVNSHKAKITELNNEIDELNNSVDSLYNDLQAAIQHNTTLQTQNSTLANENEILRNEIKNMIMPIYNRIDSSIEQLYQNVNAYHTSDDTIYNNASDIKQGFEKLYSLIERVIESNEPDKKTIIRNELIAKLTSNSWVNIIIRLNAYTKIASFKVTQIVKNDIAYLGMLITDLYKSYNIDIIVPELLKEEFNSEKQEYGNNETTWIAFLCDVKPAEHRGKIYDIIRAGYTIHNNDGTQEHHKPIVYYY